MQIVGEKAVLHGIDADFQPGQVNFIIGRRLKQIGAHRTSWVYLEVDEGAVHYGDTEFFRIGPKRARSCAFGMLFQGGACSTA